ncbi:MAG TPA: DeoR/GlpR family DNA-binding transcription regulator [Anaerolineales bacterium]
MNNSISSFERQNLIAQFVLRSQRISITELCETFSVSEATARRDLEALARDGRVQRVHGGAIALPQAPPESPILQRQDEQRDEKIRIGQAAAALAQDGETVFLGSGTTVLEIARALCGHHNLTAITNSLPVVNVLAGVEAITVICLGGMLRASELSFIGHITEQALTEVRADRVFIGTRAISVEHGLTNEFMPETMTDRAILKSGKEIIVVADHTKFGRAATILLAPLESIHTLITDHSASHEFTDAIQSRGVRVIFS